MSSFEVIFWCHPLMSLGIRWVLKAMPRASGAIGFPPGRNIPMWRRWKISIPMSRGSGNTKRVPRQQPAPWWPWGSGFDPKISWGWRDYNRKVSTKIESAYRSGETKTRVQTGKMLGSFSGLVCRWFAFRCMLPQERSRADGNFLWRCLVQLKMNKQNNTFLPLMDEEV